jgi:hypothetical protein
MAENTKPITCVVVDTNVWRSHQMLRSPTGTALVFYLRSSGASIGLPEVIEREVEKQILARMAEAADEITDQFGVIQAVMGARSQFSLPSPDDVRRAIMSRLEELDRLFVRVRFTQEHATRALDRVNAESAPNSKGNQQFKDSAIWEAILELLPR